MYDIFPIVIIFLYEHSLDKNSQKQLISMGYIWPIRHPSVSHPNPHRKISLKPNMTFDEG